MSTPSIADFVHSFSNDRFELFVLPTEQCNFRCRYCYEDFEVGRMPGTVITGIERLLAARAPTLRHLRLQWFGGEPLLALDVIRRISRHAQRLAAAHPHMIVDGVMTTNGSLLSPATLTELCSLGTRTFQISIDGPRDVHDQTRVKAGGQGTFDRIWANLRAVRQTALDVRVKVRLHLTPHNLSAMLAFAGELRQELFEDPRFTPHIVPVAHLGGPLDQEFEVLSTRAAASAVEALSAALHLPSPTDAPAPLTICYAAKGNSLVVRANGEIAKCTVAIGSPTNTLGRIEPDGTLTLDDARLRPWLTGWESQSASQLRCPLETVPHLHTPPDGRPHLPIVQ